MDEIRIGLAALCVVGRDHRIDEIGDGRIRLGAGGPRRAQPRIRNQLGTPQRPGALRLRVAASARRASAGDTVRLALRVRNRGDARLRGVEVCDRLPAGLGFVRADRRHRPRAGRHCWTRAGLGACLRDPPS